MESRKKKPELDARTDGQKIVDEAAARENWEGFITESLVTEKDALRILREKSKPNSTS
jgi:hypothetical protein